MSLFKRGNVYFSRIMRNGQVFKRSTKARNLTDARRVEAKWLMEIHEAGEVIQPLVQTKLKPASLSILQDRFFEYIDAHVAKPRTREFYKDSWKPLVQNTPHTLNVLVHKIDTSAIQRWAQERRKEVGPARVNGSLRTLRRFMNLAKDWGLISREVKITLLPGETNREYVITEPVLAKMLKHEKCTDLLRNLLPFLFDTGLRIGEAIRLKWSDIDFVGAGSVTVLEGKTKNARRRVPLTARAKDVLVKMYAHRSESDFVWTNTESNGFSLTNWPSKQFTRLRNAMKLPKDCVLHSFRHSYLTRLAEAGASSSQLMRLAGHGSVTISQRYTHLSEENLDGVVKKLG